jgi:aspartate/methionine/tyrosine aminotransferase
MVNSPIGGTPSFKQAVAEYYLNRFEVPLDPVF